MFRAAIIGGEFHFAALLTRQMDVTVKYKYLVSCEQRLDNDTGCAWISLHGVVAKCDTYWRVPGTGR